MARTRKSSRRKTAAKKKKVKETAKDAHVGAKRTHVRTVNAPKGW